MRQFWPPVAVFLRLASSAVTETDWKIEKHQLRETVPCGQWYVRGMTAKQEARSLLEKLPDNCSIEDIQYHLYVLEKVRSGLEDARQNGLISQEDAESRLSKWLSE